MIPKARAQPRPHFVPYSAMRPAMYQPFRSVGFAFDGLMFSRRFGLSDDLERALAEALEIQPWDGIPAELEPENDD